MVLRPARITPAPRSDDRRVDGCFVGRDGVILPGSTPLERVPRVFPRNGRDVRSTVVFVNGIMTDARAQLADMQRLADTGCAVVGLHNASEGFVRDLAQCSGDKLGRGRNRTVDSLVSLIDETTARGEPLHLVGHSQGALEIARALFEAARVWKDAGATPSEIRARLSNVEVETFGGASGSFPDGPRYTHVFNRLDAVPMLTGVGTPRARPGEGARLVDFKELRAPGRPDLRQGIAHAFTAAVDAMVHGTRVYFPRRSEAVDSFTG